MFFLPYYFLFLNALTHFIQKVIAVVPNNNIAATALTYDCVSMSINDFKDRNAVVNVIKAKISAFLSDKNVFIVFIILLIN